MGIANLIADGISMGVGEFLSAKAENDYIRSERQREEWECENFLDGEKGEMVQLFMEKGMSRPDAELVIDKLAQEQHMEFFVDLMMLVELGLLSEAQNDPWEPVKSGLVTFAAFLCFGCVPLLSYFPSLATDVNKQAGFDASFVMAAGLTAITLFALGAFKSRFVQSEQWWKSGLFVFLNGAAAAGAAFAIGFLLELALGTTQATSPEIDCSQCPADEL